MLVCVGVVISTISCSRGPDHKQAALGTLLLKACQNSNLELAELLLKDGADVNTKDTEGTTALMAAASAPRGINWQLMELLLKRGVDVNARDKNGKTALMLAFDKGYLNAAWLLFTKGSDANIANEKGDTPLMKFSESWEPAGWMAVQLIDRGANVNQKAKDGTTAIMAAASNKLVYSPIVNLVTQLIQKGADVNARDNQGRTALMRASENGLLEVVKLLQDKNADVNAADNEGKTSLMLALTKGHLDVAETLVKRGANVNARDKGGKTALTHANEMMLKLNQLLQQHGAQE